MPVKLSEALRKTLDSPVFATVATIKADGTPHLSVVWIDREDDIVLFTILNTTWKKKNLLRDNRMTVLVNPDDAPYTYASISGTVDFTEEGKYDFMDRLSYKYTGMRYEEFFPDVPKERDFVVVRLTPERIYDILE